MTRPLFMEPASEARGSLSPRMDDDAAPTPLPPAAPLDAMLAQALQEHLLRMQQAPLSNRVPTPLDLLELSWRIYKPGQRKLHREAESQGLRILHDSCVQDDVRMVMLVPAWLPKRGVPFDWSRVGGRNVSVVVAIRGTVQDLVGNMRCNMELLYNKLIDEDHLPDVAAHATATLQRWLSDFDAVHGLRAAGKALDVHVTGHSLGGFVAEVATVTSDEMAARKGWLWRCTSFDSPGLPDLYVRQALRRQPAGYWRAVITTYLAPPNPINMLYERLGSLVHVLIPFEHTWSHVAKCAAADAFRMAGWAVVLSVGLEAVRRMRGGRDAGAAAAEGGGGDLLHAAASRALGGAPADDEEGGGGGGGVPALLRPDGPIGPAALGVAAAAAAVTSTAAPAAAVPGAAAAAAAAAPAAAYAAGVGALAADAAAAASSGGSALLGAASRLLPLGGVLGWLAPRALGASGVIECLAGVLGVEVEEIACQHGLGSMHPCFDPHSGELEARYARPMASWPQLGSSRGGVLLKAMEQVAAWTLPSFVCRSNMGVANMMSRTAMVEARCARLTGYEPLTEEGQEEVHRRVQAERLRAMAAAADSSASCPATAALLPPPPSAAPRPWAGTTEATQQLSAHALEEAMDWEEVVVVEEEEEERPAAGAAALGGALAPPHRALVVLPAPAAAAAGDSSFGDGGDGGGGGGWGLGQGLAAAGEEAGRRPPAIPHQRRRVLPRRMAPAGGLELALA